jgi:hypothetical protein
MKIVSRAGLACAALLVASGSSLMAWQITSTDVVNNGGTQTNGTLSGTCAAIVAVNTQCLADAFSQTTTDGAYQIIGSVDAVNVAGQYFYLDMNVTVTVIRAGGLNGSGGLVTLVLSGNFNDTAGATQPVTDFMSGTCSGLGAHTDTIAGNPMTLNGVSGGNLLGTCSNGTGTLAPGTLSNLVAAFNVPTGTRAISENTSFTFGGSTAQNGAQTLKIGLSTIPEPASMMLFGSGLAGLALLRRKIFRA